MTPLHNSSDNAERGRFELVEEGLAAFADYRRNQSRVVIPYVESPLSPSGKGTADR